MNEILKLALKLALVVMIAVAMLSYTNGLTKDRIKAAVEEDVKLRLKQIFPSLDKIVPLSEEGFDAGAEIYMGDEKIGVAHQIKADGFAEAIELLVGVDMEGKIAGVSVLKQQETPGLGTKITEEWFLSQFVGKSVDELMLKADGGQIDAITSATISSNAVTKGVKSVFEIKPIS